VSPHELAAERSLALHEAVAERLRAEPNLRVAARARVAEWLQDGTVARSYADEWMTLLERPLKELLDALTGRTEHLHDLRQVSPFAGVLDPRTRWRIHREVGERAANAAR